MRFQQLKRRSNAILKKKMYKSGRNWIVKSTLSLASGLALFGVSQLTTVQADTTDLTPVSQATSESVEQPQNDDKDANADPATQPEQTKEDVSGQNTDVPQEKETPDKGDVTSETQEPAAKSAETEQQEDATVQPETPAGDGDVFNNNEPTDSTDWGIDYNLSEDGATLTINGGTLKDTSYYPDATDNMNPWITRGINTEKVTTISIENNITAGKSISGLFANFSNVKQFTGLDKIDTSNTVDMSYLFSKSGNFGEQDLNHWNVSNVENFSDMFSRNENLKKLDISNWNWANGNDFRNMFSSNTNLVSLILPKNINSTSVADRSGITFKNMFDGESALTSLDISNLDMSGVSYENIEDALINNDNLQEVTLSPQNFLAKSLLYIYRDGNMSGGTIPVSWIAVESDDPKVAVGTIKDVDKLKNMYNGLSGDYSKTTWKWDYELPMRFKARYVAEDDHSKIFYTDDEYTNQPPYTYFKTDFDASKVPSNISLDDYYTGYNGEVFLTKNDQGVALIPVPKKQFTVQVIET